jgi:hypothetical protein
MRANPEVIISGQAPLLLQRGANLPIRSRCRRLEVLYGDAQLEYSHGDDWERMARQGVQLLERLAQDDRIRIRRPHRNMQTKLVRSVSEGNDFVAYVDAVGTLDGKRCLLEWKTTTARYPEEPEGLLALDPQLICYSWISGIPDVAVMAFVRKRLSEIQYLKATISVAVSHRQDSVLRIEILSRRRGVSALAFVETAIWAGQRGLDPANVHTMALCVHRCYIELGGLYGYCQA